MSKSTMRGELIVRAPRGSTVVLCLSTARQHCRRCGHGNRGLVVGGLFIHQLDPRAFSCLLGAILRAPAATLIPPARRHTDNIRSWFASYKASSAACPCLEPPAPRVRHQPRGEHEDYAALSSNAKPLSPVRATTR